MTTPDATISLTSHWYVQPGKMDQALDAIRDLAPKVLEDEPGTLTYLVHTVFTGDALTQSLPPASDDLVLFYEQYSSPQAFHDHVTGQNFTDFVAATIDVFRQIGGKPFATVTFLTRQAGFVRSAGSLETSAVLGATANSHPAMMFEIMAASQAEATEFYSQVFGWTYDRGAEGFDYIHFPAGTPQLLGGIAQAAKGTPGMEVGTNFYLLVDDLSVTLQSVCDAGGTVLMSPTLSDGYHFAMFTDPQGLAVGLITPFGDRR